MEVPDWTPMPLKTPVWTDFNLSGVDERVLFDLVASRMEMKPVPYLSLDASNLKVWGEVYWGCRKAILNLGECADRRNFKGHLCAKGAVFQLDKYSNPGNEDKWVWHLEDYRIQQYDTHMILAAEGFNVPQARVIDYKVKPDVQKLGMSAAELFSEGLFEPPWHSRFHLGGCWDEADAVRRRILAGEEVDLTNLSQVLVKKLYEHTHMNVSQYLKHFRG
jgi:hypothetical protein